MMEFTQNDWGQRDIISIIIILTKQGTDTIHVVILKNKKYPSTTILEYANILEKSIKSPYVRLLNMTPHDAYSVIIYVHKMTISDINHKQKE